MKFFSYAFLYAFIVLVLFAFISFVRFAYVRIKAFLIRRKLSKLADSETKKDD